LGDCRGAALFLQDGNNFPLVMAYFLRAHARAGAIACEPDDQLTSDEKNVGN
jgi:hypothetical protein